jgi:hypothetical protein
MGAERARCAEQTLVGEVVKGTGSLLLATGSSKTFHDDVAERQHSSLIVGLYSEIKVPSFPGARAMEQRNVEMCLTIPNLFTDSAVKPH